MLREKMVHTIREFFSKHKDWLSTFSQNLLATVLGIVLTFGTTRFVEIQQDRKLANKLGENYLGNIELRAELMANDLEAHLQRDSLLQEVSGQWAAGRRGFSPDTIEMFKRAITSYNWHFVDHSQEQIFMTSQKVSDVLGDHAVAFGSVFETLDGLEGILDFLDKLSTETLRDIYTDPLYHQCKGKDKEMEEYLANHAGVKYFVLMHHGYTNFMRDGLKLLQEIMVKLREEWDNGIVDSTSYKR